MLCALMAFSLAARAAEQVHFTPTKASTAKLESSEVTIRGTSTLHEWEMSGATVNGTIDTDPAVWKTPGEKPARVTVSIPVSSIRSDHSKMDSLMQNALKSKANPDIRYEMATAEMTRTAGDSFVVRTTGKFTIAGATRPVTMDVTATRVSDTRYVLTGEAPITMSDYGVKPPTAMLGTIRTGPDVKVSFRWIVGRS